MHYRIILTFLFILSVAFAHAVKACPGVLEYQESDGTLINVKLYGDERFHFVTDINDLLLLPNDNECYEYAVRGGEGTPVLSGVRASLSPLQVKGTLVKGEDILKHKIDLGIIHDKFLGSHIPSVEGLKYRYSSAAFPTTGNPHSIVILVEYQDYGFSMEDPLEYYNDFLNGDNFKRDNATGSCRSYFVENSGGRFAPTFDVYGPVKLANDRRYYGGQNDRNAYRMIVEAVEALDPIIDFSCYDHNGDRYVDSVYIIYADKGEADGGPAESVWPYSWELEEEGINLWADGVKINTYGCSNELKSSGAVEGIGTFTHEFGHVLGLPDFYNTDNAYDYTTPCDWSVMDSGSYNNNTRTPPNFSSFERFSLGWLSPREILMSDEFHLTHLADSNDALIIKSDDNEDEFFMLEYRQRRGWDMFLPGHGMLIWHIDFDQREWDYNSPNNNRNHQRMRLVRADGKWSSETTSGDPFPGSSNVTEFSTVTSPSLKTWSGQELNITSVFHILEEDGTLHFHTIATENRADASVEQPRVPDDSTKHIFDISGRYVGAFDGENMPELDKGIYIINGRKIMIK